MTSPLQQVTLWSPSHRRPLLIYCLGALAVRTVDAGAGLGFLLLAHSRLDPSTPGRTGGLLLTLFTAPHLAGPLLARRLDLSDDYRRLLGVAYVSMAALLAGSTIALGSLPDVVTGIFVLCAGCAGPLLTGGLSSRLTDLAPTGEMAQRRAQALDATVYGIAGTVGPALVAAISSRVSPVVALFALCGLAMVSAVLVQTLPTVPQHASRGTPLLREVLAVVVRNPVLRRVNYLTMVTAATQAGLAVVVVQLADSYGVQSSTTAVLLAVMGAGNLLGSLVLIVHPLTGDPDRLTTRQVAVIAGCFGLCALAPDFAVALVAFAVMGTATAPFVTATFAARTRHAPRTVRAQVFVTLAALKITAASGGTALAGLLTPLGPTLMLILAAGALALIVAVSILDRRLTSKVRGTSRGPGHEADDR